MTSLTAEFDAQRRREFIAKFRREVPGLFPGNECKDSASERAAAIAHLDAVLANPIPPCAPLGSYAIPSPNTETGRVA